MGRARNGHAAGRVGAYLPALLILLTGAALSLLAGAAIHRAEARQARDVFRTRSHTAAALIQGEVGRRLEQLTFLRDFYRSSERVSPHEFVQFVAPGVERGRGTSGYLHLGPSWHSSAWPDEEQWQQADPPEEWPVDLVWPDALRERLVPRPLADDPGIEGRIEAARRTGSLIALSRGALGSRLHAAEVLVLSPVFRGLSAPLPTEDRPGRLTDFVGIVIDVRDVTTWVLQSLKAGDYEVRLCERSAEAGGCQSDAYTASLLHWKPTGEPRPPQPRIGSGSLGALEVDQPVTVMNREWLLRFRPTPAFAAAHVSNAPFYAAGAGLALTGWLTAYVLMAAAQGRRMHLKSLQLGRVNRRLARQIARQRETEHRLRMTQFTMDHAPDGVFWVDSQARIIDVNEAACRNLGYSRDDLLAMRIHDIDPGINDETWREDWEARHEPRPPQFQRVHRRRDGSTFPVEISRRLMIFDGQEYYCAFVRDITNRVEAEQALRGSEARLRQVLDLVPHMIFAKDREGRFLLVNQATADAYGYSVEELTGALQADVHPDREILSRVTAEDLQVIETGQPMFIPQQTFLRADGTRVILEVSRVPFLLPAKGERAMIAVAVDITKCCGMERLAARSEALLKCLVDSVPDLIFYKDENGAYIGCNLAFTRYAGLTEQQIKGKTDLELFPSTDANHYRVRDRRVMEENRSIMNEECATYPDGRQVLLETIKTPFVSPDGQLLGIIGVSRDITQRKRNEEELVRYRMHLEKLVEERSQEVIEAQRQILQADKLVSIGRLAAGIAHEINTPIQYVGDNISALGDILNSLSRMCECYAGLARAVETGSSAADALAAVRKGEVEHELDYLLADAPQAVSQSLEGVQRVARIVQAMKDFSHVDRGEACVIDINKSLDNALTVARNEYKYVADIDRDFGDVSRIECYAGEINQVFLNLLVNAAHAIADTGRHGQITVSTRPAGESVEIRVADTGTGIPEHVRDKIFEPFFTTKEIGRGTGQGLYIAHQIVTKRHGGGLSFETTEGKGTTFIIRLPIKHQDSSDAREASPENVQENTTAGAAM